MANSLAEERMKTQENMWMLRVETATTLTEKLLLRRQVHQEGGRLLQCLAACLWPE